MKRLLLLLLLVAAAQTAYAQTLTFQGVLRDPAGRTVGDGDYILTIRLYDAEMEGNELWNETLSDVPIRHGVFSIELGETNSLGSLSFDRIYWLGIAVEDGEELPIRMKLTNTPYSVSVRGTGNQFPSTGPVGIGTTEPATDLYVSGSGGTYVTVNATSGDSSGYAFEANGTREWEVLQGPADHSLRIVKTDSGAVVTVVPGGDVGIGTTSPQSGLHIAGDGGTNVDFTVDGQMRSEGDEGGLWVSDDRLIGGHETDKVGIYAGEDWRLTVQSDGKVGIGTTSPTEALEVSGEVKLSSGGAVMFSDGTSIATSAVGGSAESLANPDNARITADNDGDNTGAVQLLTRGATRLTVANNGNVGFGTTTPSSKLHIAGDVNFTGRLLKGTTPFASNPWDTTGNDIYYNRGNVGIGTSSPAYDLDVNGIINAADIYKDGSPMTSDWETRTHGSPDRYPNPIMSTRKKCAISPSSSLTADDFYEESLFDAYPYTNYVDLLIDGSVWVENKYGSDHIKISEGNITPTSYYSNAGIGGYDDSGENDVRPVDEMYVRTIHCVQEESDYFSDRAVKQNIRPVSNALGRVLRLNGARYNIDPATHPFYKGQEMGEEEAAKDRLGFIAQELKEVLPELVAYNEDTELYETKNCHQLFPVLVEALKELRERNEALRARAGKLRLEFRELKESGRVGE